MTYTIPFLKFAMDSVEYPYCISSRASMEWLASIPTFERNGVKGWTSDNLDDEEETGTSIEQGFLKGPNFEVEFKHIKEGAHFETDETLFSGSYDEADKWMSLMFPREWSKTLAEVQSAWCASRNVDWGKISVGGKILRYDRLIMPEIARKVGATITETIISEDEDDFEDSRFERTFNGDDDASVAFLMTLPASLLKQVA